MYQPHPSLELNRQFTHRPFQGVDPASATFLFIGLDANYDENIGQSPIFQSVLEYHRDGVAFWCRDGVHHPFLLPQYSGDGLRYHRNFARIGFLPKHATLISFVELLHVPTVGRSKLAPEDPDNGHLRGLNAAILDGTAQHVFISAGVAGLMRASKAFPWLPPASSKSETLPVLYRRVNQTVYSYLHFSNYGKFQQQLEKEAKAIASLLPQDD